MKKIIFLALIVCSCQLVSAQERQDTIPPKQDTTTNKMKAGYITMQAGQVFVVKDGKPIKLEKDKILKDGTIVTIEGKVKKTDGTTVQMKEGDKVYLDEGMLLNNSDPVK